MFESTFQAILFVASVAVFTAAASVWDTRVRRIPNWLNLAFLGVGLLYRGGFHGGAGLLDAAAGFGIGFGTFFVLWLIGGGGGGDVKLMAAIGVWLGMTLTILAVVLSTVFVLIAVAIAYVYDRIEGRIGSRRERVDADETPASEGTEPAPSARKVPFAVPVTLATWTLVALRVSEFFRAAP